MSKEKRQKVSFALLPKSKKRLYDAAIERDIPVSVLVRDMLNHAMKNGYKIT